MKYGKEIDACVVVKVREGDEQSFRLVYDLYSPRLYNFAFQFLKSKELSEEIVQETLINVWVTRHRLDEQYPMGAYLYTIARRLSLNMLRQLATSQTSFEKLGLSTRVAHNETEDGVIVNDLAYFIESIVTKLPAKQQEVFRLSRYKGLSHEEIAEHMQLSENTIRNHIASALKKLRLKVNQSDVFFFIVYLLLR